MRLFVALNLPSEIQKEIQHWQNRWQKFFPAPAVRWVKVANIHLTLCFLGEIDEHTEKDIAKNLAGINCPGKISLRISGVGFFPEVKKPRVFYLQIENPENNLSILAENVRQISQQIITLPDDKPFRPHLTVARIKTRLPDPPEPEKLNEEITKTNLSAWVANEFYLMASNLTPTGPIYSVRQVFSLK